MKRIIFFFIAFVEFFNRQHINSPEKFLSYFEQTVKKLSASGRPIFIMSEGNINLLSYEWCKYAQ